MKPPTLSPIMNRSAWIFSQTMALMLVSCLLAGCRNTRVEIPKPTDVLEPPPSAPSVEQSAQAGSKPIGGDRPLPPLELSSHSQDGFHLAVPLLAEYSVINRRLEQRLVGQEFPTSLGEPLKIIPVHMYGSGANLILNLGVTGAVNGNLYVTGKPIFDEATQTLSFQLVAFTVDTKNVLVRMADRLFYGDLLVRLEPRTRIDLSITSRSSAGSSQGT